MRAPTRGNLWIPYALSLTLWAAVVTSPLRPAAAGHAPPNYLQRNFATCRVQRVRYVAKFDRASRIGLLASLARGGSRPDVSRPKPSAFSPPSQTSPPC
jgi:hypothetical protein